MIFKMGDLLKQESGILVHQVNCQGKMGAGLALDISRKWPHVKTEYIEYVAKNGTNKRGLLGTVLFVPVDEKGKVIVANLFGQYTYGREPNVQYTNYNAVKQGLQICVAEADKRQLQLYIPFNIWLS